MILSLATFFNGPLDERVFLASIILQMADGVAIFGAIGIMAPVLPIFHHPLPPADYGLHRVRAMAGENQGIGEGVAAFAV